MSDYKMILHLWPGAIGHIAAELEGPDGRRRVIGFGPAGEKDVAGKEAALPTKRFYGDGDAVRDGDVMDVHRNETLPSSPTWIANTSTRSPGRTPHGRTAILSKVC
jgi:hypothetical protein